MAGRPPVSPSRPGPVMRVKTSTRSAPARASARCGPPSQQSARHAPLGQRPQGGVQVDLSRAVGIDADHLDAEGGQHALGVDRRAARGEDQGRTSRALRTSVVEGSRRRFESSTTRRGERSDRPGSRTVEGGIVGSRSADADQDRIRVRPPEMHGAVGDGPGDPQALGGRACETILGLGELEVQARPPPRHAGDVPAMIAGGLLRQEARGHRDAGGGRRLWPRPATRGSGSSRAVTTRAMPAATMASVQGGVRP